MKSGSCSTNDKVEMNKEDSLVIVESNDCLHRRRRRRKRTRHNKLEKGHTVELVDKNFPASAKFILKIVGVSCVLWAFALIYLCVKARSLTFEANIHYLRMKVLGQTLALRKLEEHMALVHVKMQTTLVFVGSVGVGKSFVSHSLTEINPQINSRELFCPSDLGVLGSKYQIYSYLQSQMSCGINIFVFEDVDYIDPEKQEGIVSFLRKAKSENDPVLSIINLNVPSQYLIEKMLELEKVGVTRENITTDLFNSSLLVNNQFLSMLKNASVPFELVLFLPLEKHHVSQCLPFRLNIQLLEQFYESLEYDDSQKRFPKYGCKKLGIFNYMPSTNIPAIR